MGQQQGTELSPSLLGRFMKGGERPLVRGVDACVVLDEQGGYVYVLGTREEVTSERRTKTTAIKGFNESKCVNSEG